MRGLDVAVVTSRLQSAGCVFAAEEAAVLTAAAATSDDLDQLVARREAGEPLEHVVGWVDFAGQRLSVGPGVFVPRQRSLLLARLAVRAARCQREPVVWEVCAGVAPLAATVAVAVPPAAIYASDVDPLALSHARRNLPGTAAVFEANLLAGPAALRGRVTLVLGVPPYVPITAAHLLTHEARGFEPPAALFAGPDGLDVVRTLIAGVGRWLAPGGRVLLEISAGQYAAAAACGIAAGFQVRRHGSRADRRLCVAELSAVPA